ncbi:MAG: hypothetical protein ACWGHO_02690 [Candidatus Moraniibacteriota bacterium]
MEKVKELSGGRLIKAELYSRPNAINGKYKTGQLGLELENLLEIKDSDIFFLETLKMKADLADKIIAEAELGGRDTNDSNIMKELGEKINAMGEPLHKNEVMLDVIFAPLYFIVVYGITIGVWGIVFRKSFLTFSFYGVIAGLLIGLLFASPLIARQRTREQIKDILFVASSLWGNLGIIIGVIGLIALAIRLVFF